MERKEEKSFRRGVSDTDLKFKKKLEKREKKYYIISQILYMERGKIWIGCIRIQ